MLHILICAFNCRLVMNQMLYSVIVGEISFPMSVSKPFRPTLELGPSEDLSIPEVGFSWKSSLQLEGHRACTLLVEP